jgi:hypothetical protein
MNSAASIRSIIALVNSAARSSTSRLASSAQPARYGMLFSSVVRPAVWQTQYVTVLCRRWSASQCAWEPGQQPAR